MIHEGNKDVHMHANSKLHLMYQGLTATGIIINVSLITGKQLENKTTQTWTPNDSKHSHHYITCMQLYKQLKLWCEAAAGETREH